MYRPNKSRYCHTPRLTPPPAPMSGPLPICDNPRFVERVTVPRMPEPCKQCRQCFKRKAGDAFGETGRGCTLEGHPLRRNVCIQCEKGGAA